MSFQTRKSFKSQLRDRPSHSSKLTTTEKRSGGGAFNWGRPGDELKPNPVQKADPNYEENLDELKGIRFSTAKTFSPTEPARRAFHASVRDYNRFKTAVKQAAREFLNSADALEFAQCVREIDLPLANQDLVYILVKFGLDLSAGERAQLEKLIERCLKDGLITPAHVAASVRKLYNQVSDLTIDCPDSLARIREFTENRVSAGEIDKSVLNECEKMVAALADAARVQEVKERAQAIFLQFYRDEDGDTAAAKIHELAAPELHFEVVKILLSLALDRGNRQRELASHFLAVFTGDLLKLEQVERAFSILIERVEDLFLDVPNILRLLSCFLARAIVDEAVTPAFLVRQDIADTDLGAQVLLQASALVNQEKAQQVLLDCWESYNSEENVNSIPDKPEPHQTK